MIFAEPAPTQGDIHFRFLDIPVRIHPFFWVVGVLLSLRGETPPEQVLVWIVALLISILVHELGHALMQRKYGGKPRIVLHGMGGLAICGDCDRSTRAQIVISLAGPVAGFLFASALLLVINMTGHRAGFTLGEPSVSGYRISLVGVSFYWEAFASDMVNSLISGLMQINVVWGLVNLLPIYPLDGGQISREICQLGKAREGMVLSLKISVVAAAGMVIAGLAGGQLYIALLFGYLAYSSYKTLEAYRASLW